jgi:uncharacterized protein YfeS
MSSQPVTPAKLNEEVWKAVYVKAAAYADQVQTTINLALEGGVNLISSNSITYACDLFKVFYVRSVEKSGVVDSIKKQKNIKAVLRRRVINVAITFMTYMANVLSDPLTYSEDERAAVSRMVEIINAEATANICFYQEMTKALTSELF